MTGQFGGKRVDKKQLVRNMSLHFSRFRPDCEPHLQVDTSGGRLADQLSGVSPDPDDLERKSGSEQRNVSLVRKATGHYSQRICQRISSFLWKSVLLHRQDPREASSAVIWTELRVEEVRSLPPEKRTNCSGQTLLTTAMTVVPWWKLFHRVLLSV